MNVQHSFLPAVKFVLVAFLSVAVVIYAQVVWQKYQLSQQVRPATSTDIVVEPDVSSERLSQQEREAVFADLQAVSNPTELTAAERTEIFAVLQAKQTAAGSSLTEAERQELQRQLPPSQFAN